ncbi:hypothetical protein FXO37_04256 [Capsicum annuum]|nr:hypothetical protein FXO37_04256 [Capsicum annuum]
MTVESTTQELCDLALRLVRAMKNLCYVELIDPPSSFTSHRPRRGRPRKIPIPMSILPENSNPENGKTLKGVNEVATSLTSSEDTTMLNDRVVPKMDAVVKKRVKLKKRV